MSSEFLPIADDDIHSQWKAISAPAGGRYCFFKVRLHGRLHFVKAVSPEYKNDLRTHEALRKEFEIGYNLSHPYIVNYLQCADDYIYQEYVDGKTLRQMIDNDDPTLKKQEFIVKICRQLLEAVEYIHSQGVLHLDIKPENVMITRIGGNVKILDFGCAYCATDDTTQGFTLQYKAPEQGEGETNGYTDIYLIGKIIAEIAEHAGCRSRWRKFVARSTAEKASDRFATEAQAIAAIPSPHRGRKIVVAIAALLGVAAIVALLLLIIPSSETPTVPPTETISVAETHEPQKVDTPAVAVAQEPTAPQPQPVAPVEDTLTKIERTITDNIISYYVTLVKPMCPPDSLTTASMEQFQRQTSKAKEAAFQLRDRLIRQYPQYEAQISNYVLSTINAQQIQAGEWYYGKRFH